ncbi:MAG: hypothetical protein GX239_03815 [Clostridiaceae bacterium]|jgi:hypothetical protein|nr:hypothetical protein [Clostridiaceae bacterium]
MSDKLSLKRKNNLINDENEASKKEFVTEGLADSTFKSTPNLLKNRIQRWQNLILVNSPGMRIIKTAIAILICLLVSYMFDINTAMQSSIAAIVCLGQDIRNTWRVSKNRLIGTLIAGVYAYLFILFSLVFLEMTPLTIGYLIMTGIFVIPLMSFLVRIKKPGGVVIAAIVFIIIALSVEGQAEDPLLYVAIRILHTLLGVAAAMFVNWFPPLNMLGRHLKKVQLRAAFRAEELDAIMKEAMNYDDEDLDVIVQKSDGTMVSRRRIKRSKVTFKADQDVSFLDPYDPIVTLPDEVPAPEPDPYDPPQQSDALDIYEIQTADDNIDIKLVVEEPTADEIKSAENESDKTE